MKTKFHAYKFDVTKPAQAKAYRDLCDRLESAGVRKFSALGGTDFVKRLAAIPTEVTLETAFLFADQWNTAPVKDMGSEGLRLFDWGESICPNPNIKEGYWLEITDELREARRNRNACGFCGRQEEAAKGAVFCGQCIDFPYLKQEEIYLTRMQSVSLGMKARPPLTERETERLLPEYREAQLRGATERGKARIRKEREDIEARFARKTENAKTERDGIVWLMDHGIRTDNVIFYEHTGRFCFGWRSPMSAEVVSSLLDIISEFSYPYDIKCADGRTLSGN